LGVVALVEKELAVGQIPQPAGLCEHVAQGTQKVIPPVVLKVVVVVVAFLAAGSGQLVADNVAVGPPLRSVRHDGLGSTATRFVAVVLIGIVVVIQAQVLGPRVAVPVVDKGRENAQLPIRITTKIPNFM